MHGRIVGLLVASLAIIPWHSAWGQLILDRSSDHTIWVEWLKPNFPNVTTGFTNGVLFAIYRGQVSPKTTLVVDLPMANADIGSSGGKQTLFGNPYIGVEYGRSGASTYWEGGLRLPVASEDDFLAALVGLETDFDRAEAFLPDLLTITTRFNYHNVRSSGAMFHLRPGLTFWIPTSGGGPELLFDYVIVGGYEKGRVATGAQLSGRLVVTSESGDFTDRTVNQISLFGRVRFGSVIPGLELRLPLGDDLDPDYIMVFRIGLAV